MERRCWSQRYCSSCGGDRGAVILMSHSDRDFTVRLVQSGVLLVRIIIIGAGNVGRTLGKLSHQAGHEIRDVVCLSKRSAAAAVKFIGAGRAWASNLVNLSPADLVLVSTPDDRIPKAVELIESKASTVGRPVVLHTSGAIASTVLGGLNEFGMSAGSCHPLQTFESPKRALAIVGYSYFCIEGERRAVRVARRFVRDVGARYFEIPTEMKSLYHAAAVMSSGGVVALLSFSLDMLARCGLTPSEARRVLLPLVEGTVANVSALGPERALTGPVRRGDSGTVARNLAALGAVDPDAAEVYRRLAERAVMLVEGHTANPGGLLEVRRQLK
jgi:predicted short-subunit dehydrogenase-like oxidoreductase (DUF2520 family)